uniref:Uncharacterized protein n=1 Tax=Arundo donax TaxID=35708 RepID=A0A0A9AZR3_ARUDO
MCLLRCIEELQRCTNFKFTTWEPRYSTKINEDFIFRLFSCVSPVDLTLILIPNAWFQTICFTNLQNYLQFASY